MFMKLSDIYEAQYTSHERGSLHWILDKFFVGPNRDGEYWIKENEVIALYKGKEIIGLSLVVDNQGRNRITMIPNAGGRNAAFAAPLDEHGTARHLKIYSSKRLV